MKFSFSSEVEFGKDISELEPSSFDAFLFLDSSAVGVISGKLGREYAFPNSKIVNIDHHKSNGNYGFLNYVDYTKKSCCALLMEFFSAVNVPIDKELADRLLIGVATDDGFPNCPVQTLKDVVMLSDYGADYTGLVVDIIRRGLPLKIRKLHAIVIDNLRISGSCAYSTVTHSEVQKLGLNKAEVRYAITPLDDLGDVDVIFTLVELEDHVKGSIRSRKGIDVSRIAQTLGGGGHINRAAFKVTGLNLDEATAKVLDALIDAGIPCE